MTDKMLEAVAGAIKHDMNEYVREGYLKNTFLAELSYAAARIALDAMQPFIRQDTPKEPNQPKE